MNTYTFDLYVRAKAGERAPRAPVMGDDVSAGVGLARELWSHLHRTDANPRRFIPGDFITMGIAVDALLTEYTGASDLDAVSQWVAAQTLDGSEATGFQALFFKHNRRVIAARRDTATSSAG